MMLKLKCILIENSKVRRRQVIKLIENHPSLELVAAHSNALEVGLEAHREIDLIFLAIELPIINGFDYMQSLRDLPMVILIGGNTDYGVKAFDFGVTDYLSQPITNDRFHVAIKKVIAITEQKMGKKEDEEHIFVRNKLNTKRVILSEIEWVEAYGDYIKLVLINEKVIVLSTMADFIKRLPQDKFVRIHKSFIINLEKVDRFNCNTVMVNGNEIPLSRNRKKEFRTALVN